MGDKLMKINKQLAALLAATVVPLAASADDDNTEDENPVG